MKGPKPKQFKVCKACGVEKPRAEFYKKGTSVTSLCKPCSLLDSKARAPKYRGKYIATQNAWRREKYRSDPAYRERISAAKKARYQLRKDAINEKRRQEWAANPMCSARKHNRWHDIKERCPKWADLDAILAFYASCKVGYEVDHIIPLKGLIDGRPVSGLHVLWNLQYLTVQQNRKKYNRISEATLQILS